MKTKLMIEDVKLEDLESIVQINKTALGYDFSQNETKERLKYVLNTTSDKLIAAKLNGKVIGYIHGADYNPVYSQPLKNILALAVLPEYQGYGAGKALLIANENWARECGCTGVRLVSGYNRVEAHEFYCHCGYTMRKEQKNFIKIF